MRIIVDDDGPGLSPSEREQVATRGRRLDETKPGSGLGLSIVVELAGLYGGETHARHRADRRTAGGAGAAGCVRRKRAQQRRRIQPHNSFDAIFAPSLSALNFAQTMLG